MLIANWRQALTRAWSVRLWAAASLVLLAEPFVDLALQLSEGWSLTIQIILRAISGLLGLAGIWARVIKQKEFGDAD